MLNKIQENRGALHVSIAYIVLSIIEIVIGVTEVGKRGFTSFYTIEISIAIALTLCILVYLLIKYKLKKKILMLTLILILVGAISMLIQFLPPSLSSTMPNRYLSMGASYGVFYRIDLFQGELPDPVLALKSSSYIININFIMSVLLIVANTINAILFIRRKNI